MEMLIKIYILDEGITKVQELIITQRLLLCHKLVVVVVVVVVNGMVVDLTDETNFFWSSFVKQRLGQRSHVVVCCKTTFERHALFGSGNTTKKN